MLLLIDAGNSRVKWALANDAAPLGQWSASGAVTHAELESLPTHWLGLEIKRTLACNVAGPQMRARLDALLPSGAAWLESKPELKGMRNLYRNPAQLGVDRFAAALAARTLASGKPAIVAMCGTATTVDAITSQGDFAGGMILPGLALMANALARNTAQLPQVEPRELPGGFADNTDDAIVSGILSAQAGAIERAVALHKAEVLFLSGGAAPWVAPALRVPFQLVDNMVLAGLHAAAL
ncbi:type III pantothenate kinase [Massilia arenosa]|uniref:Type III pantothenate kinase n=1 Tax=Zemynaea arenosa TaxID=2561931 RepID=A0A4Y9SAV8_9BURK|nr:type III pantothenate kinase [Massilia arenosa]TFW18825.1 type III pantothenate kinase [Massilia arenosa]